MRKQFKPLSLPPRNDSPPKRNYFAAIRATRWNISTGDSLLVAREKLPLLGPWGSTGAPLVPFRALISRRVFKMLFAAVNRDTCPCIFTAHGRPCEIRCTCRVTTPINPPQHPNPLLTPDLARVYAQRIVKGTDSFRTLKRKWFSAYFFLRKTSMKLFVIFPIHSSTFRDTNLFFSLQFIAFSRSNKYYSPWTFLAIFDYLGTVSSIFSRWSGINNQTRVRFRDRIARTWIVLKKSKINNKIVRCFDLALHKDTLDCALPTGMSTKTNVYYFAKSPSIVTKKK